MQRRDPGPAFGVLLRRYREAAGLTQEGLAERAGVSARAVSDLERGVNRAPRADTLGLLAKALQLPPEDRTRLEAAGRRVDESEITPSVFDAPATMSSKDVGVRLPIEDRTPSVVLSYTAEDGEFAARLLNDLAARGIAGWPERTELRRGAGGPEGLRTAMRACRAVALVVSPAARASRLVTMELGLAEMYGRAIVPVWAAGDRWLECAPAELAGVPCVDARGARYPEAVAALVAALGAISPGWPLEHSVPAPAAPAAPRNPYKGLRAFVEEDAGDFFGRTAFVQTLLEIVAATLAGGPPAPARLLAVVGPSGSGKSSLVRAGLLTRLKAGAVPGSEGWVYLDPVLPGAHPLEALAVSLAGRLDRSIHTLREDLSGDDARGLHLWARQLAARLEQRVVLLVDQFEELFTLTTDEQERRQFIDLLLTATTESRGSLLVMLTLRADFYDRPLAYPAFGALLQSHGQVVLPMSTAELREAIERPAGLPDVQLSFESGLVGDLLYEVAGQAGALPLLEFTLEQLADRRQGRLLTAAVYQEIGGVRGALSRQAEATFAALPSDAHRDLARALFLRLIDPGATEQDTTRRRAALEEMTLPDSHQSALMQDVADAFVAARLLTSGEHAGVTTLDVSHEALISAWSRLAGWLREAREDVRLQQTISADAAAWARRGRQADHLYRGSVLEEAQAWAARNVPSAWEVAFLEAGVAEAQRQEAAQREAQARELGLAQAAVSANRRAAGRLRALAVVLALFLVVAAGLSVAALNNASDASRARTRAAANASAALSALSRVLALQAGTLLNSQLQVALLLSVEADRLNSSPQTRASLVRAVNSNPRLLAFLATLASPVESVAFSPNGAILASGSGDGTVRLWDVAHRGALGPPLAGHSDAVNSVVFSPDGKTLASASNDGTVRLWDVVRRQPLGPSLTGQPGFLNSVAFSPDGRILACGGSAGTIQLWDVTGHRPLGAPLGGQAGFVYGLAFSPDGRLLAAGSGDGTIRLWDVARRRTIGPALSGHSGEVHSLTFSPDGRTLAAGGGTGTIVLWDVASGRVSGASLTGHTGPVYSVAFSSDGTTLASGGEDGTIRLWDVATRLPVGSPYPGHGGPVYGVAFSPDGTTLASGGEDGTIRLWDAAASPASPASPASRVLAGHSDQVNSVAFSPDGRILASSSNDATIRLWNVSTGRLLGPPLAAHAGPVLDEAFSPDGRTLVSHSYDGETAVSTIRFWSVPTGRPLGTPNIAHTGTVDSEALSADGKIVALGGEDGTIWLWDVARRRPPRPWLTTGGAVGLLAFSRDGTVLASGGADNTIRLWSTASGRALGPSIIGPALWAMAFSPDGTILAAGGTGTVFLWDVASGRALVSPHTWYTACGYCDTSSVAFSPGSTTLAAGDAEGTVSLWDVASGQALGPALAGQESDIASLAFSPDGGLLASGSYDATVRLWPMPTRQSPVQRACAIANRNLTPQEWRQYLSDLPYHKTCGDVP